MPLRTHNLFRFLSYVKPYWLWVVIAAIGGIIKFTLPIMTIELLRRIVNDFELDTSLTLDQQLGKLVFRSSALLGIFLLVYAPGVYARHYYIGRAAQRAIFDLRCDLYYKIIRMSSSFFDQRKSGSIVARLVSDINLAQNLIGTALTNIWMDGAAVILYVVYLLWIDVPAAIVALLTFPVYLSAWRIFRTRIQKTTRSVQEEIEAMSGNATEKVAGNRIVHSFTREKAEQKRFHSDVRRILSSSMERVKLQSLNLLITATLTRIAPVIVIFYSGWRVIHGAMLPGDIAAVMLCLDPLYLPLQRFSELNVVFANSMAAIDRIFEIMDEEPEIQDPPSAREIPDCRGAVTFEKVNFTYRSDVPVLRDVSFRADPGTKIALVGPSGSGKSTLVSLIPRFYDVDEGTIRVDGNDIRELKIRALRKHIGIVLQDPVLFSGSIRENILYGRPDATEEAFCEACRNANALDFIRGLHDGFDTEVGERGLLLSGGQKQRITIARAFLKDPRILILDEATSALDAESERILQDALQRLMEGRTTFIIAHRLSTIIGADLIMVLEDGRIVQRGTHEELLAEGGLYQHLYEQQFETLRTGTQKL